MKNKKLVVVILVIIIIILSVGAFVIINNNKNNNSNNSANNTSTKKKDKKESVLEKKESDQIILSESKTLKNGIYKVNDDYTIKVKNNKLSVNDKVVKTTLSNVYSKVSIIDKYIALTAYNKSTKSNTLYLFDKKGKQIYALSKINELKIQNNVDAVKYYDDYALVTVSLVNDKDFTCKGKYKKNTIEIYKLIYPTDNKYKDLTKELLDSTTIKRSDLCK